VNVNRAKWPEVIHMKLLSKIPAVQENMGFLDRSVRFIVGSVLIIPLDSTTMTISPALMAWLPYVVIVSLYLLITGMLSWDPLYAALLRLLE
jgi:hypothetical protein